MDTPDNAKLIEAFVVTPDDAHAKLKLIEELRVVRDRQIAGADDWQYSLLHTFEKYIEAIGVEPNLRTPLMKMLLTKQHEIAEARRRAEGKSGAPPMPLAKMNAMAWAAAAVTALKRQGKGSTAEVLTLVARTAGIDRKALKTFRDNINRGLGRGSEHYNSYVQHIEVLDLRPAEILQTLATLHGFVL
jgi:hypothetical protein